MGRYNSDRIREARERIEATIRGERTDRCPIVYDPWLAGGDWEVAAKDDEASLRSQLDKFDRVLAECPDCDFIPRLETTSLGQAMIPSMFGLEVVYDPGQPPYTVGRLVEDLEKGVDRIPERIDPETDGLGPKLRERVRYYIEKTDGEVPVVVADHQSPYGVATKLVANEALMIGMYTAPEMVHEVMRRATQAIADVIRAMERWAGSPDLIARSPYTPYPGGGLVLWDDYISVITPALHEEFCRPHNMDLYREFGFGHMHTCGPYFPGYIGAMTGHKGLRTADIPSYLTGFSRTREDMLRLKEEATASGITLIGDPGTFETPPEWQAPDEELMRRMAEGGRFIVSTGNKDMIEQYRAWLG